MYEIYMGATGFIAPEQARRTLRTANEVMDHLFMVGVLHSSKALFDRKNMKEKYRLRTAESHLIKDIFTDDPRALNLVHYNLDHARELQNPNLFFEDLCDITDLAGPNFDGFQLNMAWPDRYVIRDYLATENSGKRMVLQLSAGAVKAAKDNPQFVADRLELYAQEELITDILFDPSGGKGEPFNTKRALSFLQEMHDRNWKHINLGVAGGLGPGRLNHLQDLWAEFPFLNIDAEGALMNEHGTLCTDRVSTYLCEAANLFNQSHGLTKP